MGGGATGRLGVASCGLGVASCGLGVASRGLGTELILSLNWNVLSVSVCQYMDINEKRVTDVMRFNDNDFRMDGCVGGGFVDSNAVAVKWGGRTLPSSSRKRDR